MEYCTIGKCVGSGVMVYYVCGSLPIYQNCPMCIDKERAAEERGAPTVQQATAQRPKCRAMRKQCLTLVALI